MNQPRELKELLQILLDYIQENGVPVGMCVTIGFVEEENLITVCEWKILYEWLKEKKEENGFSAYFFTMGEAQPRIEFLNQEIEKL